MNLNKQVDFSAITKKTWTREQIFKIFCGVMLGGICLFLISLLVLGLDRWRYLFYLYSDPTNYFMDFFAPLYWTVPMKNLYQDTRNLYPPLVSLIEGITGTVFGSALPELVYSKPILGLPNCQTIQTCFPMIESKHPITTFTGVILITVFFATSLFAFFKTVWAAKKGAWKTKLIFCLLICFSMPFIWWVERANYIIFALAGSLIFVMCYNNPKKTIKHLALLALAIAINIKIYPAALGLLLVKEKHYKDIIYLGIYTVLLFVVSVSFVGGFDSIILLSQNLKMNSEIVVRRGFGFVYDLTSTLKMLLYAVCGKDFALSNQIFSVISVLILPVGAVAAYFVKSKWKTLAILCLLMILVPQISFTYVLLFMVIPLIYFLDEKEYYNFRDMLYLLLFCLIFMVNIPIKAPIIFPMGFPVLMDNFCARLACLIMFIMLCNDGLKCFWKSCYGFKRV